MRIVGGTLSGRKIAPPLSLSTRPMMDRIRQALFNILEHHDWGRNLGDVLTGAPILDGFCGTGALAFESISHGASKAFLFDKDPDAIKIARQNAASLGIEPQCHIAPGDALAPAKALDSCKLVFLAPPYRKSLIAPALLAYDQAGWIAPHALIVVETAKKEPPEIPDSFTTVLSRSYADTTLHFATR